MSSAKTIAIIPARGGSKRIPRKNIREFCGKPMIAHSIETALRTGLFDQVVVSTDDNEIARVASECGASSPFMRPSNLSDDYTPTLAVIRHAIEQIETLQNNKLEHICCIYATAPFLAERSLKEGYDCLLRNPRLDFSFTATSYAFPIQRALYLDSETDTVKMFQPEYASTRSQDLKEAYHDAGQFYWGRRDAFLSYDNIFYARSTPVVLPRDQVQDIDNPEDWDYAERLFLIHKKQI